MKVGTLFKYRYPYGQRQLRYGVIVEDLGEDILLVQWLDAAEPYKATRSDMINLLKSGNEESGIII
tara:strand:- start:155 stop:352 length:198 start_codon:yes stop_codon:yes gene_type:complete